MTILLRKHACACWVYLALSLVVQKDCNKSLNSVRRCEVCRLMAVFLVWRMKCQVLLSSRPWEFTSESGPSQERSSPTMKIRYSVVMKGQLVESHAGEWDNWVFNLQRSWLFLFLSVAFYLHCKSDFHQWKGPYEKYLDGQGGWYYI